MDSVVIRSVTFLLDISRRATVGSRAFLVAGPQTCNDLPEDVTSAESLATFRRLLKTHLFRKSSSGYLLDILNVSGGPSSSSAICHLKID